VKDERATPQEGDHPPQFFVSGRHIRWLILFLVLAITVLAFFLRDELTDVESTVDRLGYPAIFLISIIGAAGLVIPLPSTAAVFFGGDLLNPLYVGLLAGFAEAIGEITGYALGYTGQEVLAKNRFYPRIERWVRKRGWPIILIFAAIPNPIFDILGIAAGALQYPLAPFLAIAWVGKTIKNIGIAYAGSLGANWVVDIIRI